MRKEHLTSLYWLYMQLENYYKVEADLIPYSEIDEKLGNLLKEFGPKQTNTGTQYPFWRLQNDGIWKVSDADKIGLTDSGDALKGDLVRYNVSGGFSETITQRLQQDSKPGV